MFNRRGQSWCRPQRTTTFLRVHLGKVGVLDNGTSPVRGDWARGAATAQAGYGLVDVTGYSLCRQRQGRASHFPRATSPSKRHGLESNQHHPFHAACREFRLKKRRNGDPNADHLLDSTGDNLSADVKRLLNQGRRLCVLQTPELNTATPPVETLPHVIIGARMLVSGGAHAEGGQTEIALGSLQEQGKGSSFIRVVYI